jgi:hypothetical protein
METPTTAITMIDTRGPLLPGLLADLARQPAQHGTHPQTTC